MITNERNGYALKRCIALLLSLIMTFSLLSAGFAMAYELPDDPYCNTKMSSELPEFPEEYPVTPKDILTEQYFVPVLPDEIPLSQDELWYWEGSYTVSAPAGWPWRSIVARQSGDWRVDTPIQSNFAAWAAVGYLAITHCGSVFSVAFSPEDIQVNFLGGYNAVAPVYAADGVAWYSIQEINTALAANGYSFADVRAMAASGGNYQVITRMALYNEMPGDNGNDEPCDDCGYVECECKYDYPLPPDRIAHWRLDEIRGGTVHDIVSDYWTAVSGGSLYEGKHGNALIFGTTTTFLPTINAPLQLAEFSGAMWINVYSLGQSQELFTTETDGHWPPGTFMLSVTPEGHLGATLIWEQWHFHSPTSVDYDTYMGEWGLFYSRTTPISANTWHHVAFTYNSETGRLVLYADGNKIAGATYEDYAGATAGPSLRLGLPTIGGRRMSWPYHEQVFPGTRFTGLMDEVQFYGRALTSDEITEIFEYVPDVTVPPRPYPPTIPELSPTGALPENYIARWPLNEIYRESVIDMRTMLWDQVSLVDLVPGRFIGVGGEWEQPERENMALDLTGATAAGFVVMRDLTADTPVSGFDNGLSVAMWINAEDLSRGDLFTTFTPIDPYFLGWPQFRFGVNPDGSIFVSAGPGGWATFPVLSSDPGTIWDSWSWSTPAGLLTEGQWHHIVISYNVPTGAASVYVDGERAGGVVYGSPRIAPDPAGFWFGAHERGFQGKVDHIVMWNRGLTSAEARQAYSFVPDWDDAFPPTAVDTGVFYVCQATGNDSNDGLSRATAFKTIQRAADIAVGGQTIRIFEGVYEESVRPANNGTADYPLRFEAAPGERVVISGANRVRSEWTQVPAGNPTAVEFNPLQTNLWRTNVVLPMPNHRNQIYIDRPGGFDSVLVARYPNVPDYRHPFYDPNWIQYWFSGDSRGSVGGWNAPTGLASGRIVGRVGHLNQPANTWAGASVVGFDNRLWNIGGAEVVSSGTNWEGTGRGYLQLVNLNWFEIGPTGYDPGYFDFYIQNAFAALDAPNEWWYGDRPGYGNALWLQLPEGENPNELSVYYKARTYGLNLNNRRHIHVVGIDLLGSSMSLANSEHVIIDSMTAEHVTHYQSPLRSGETVGIHISGRNNTIMNSRIAYSSGPLLNISGIGHRIVNNKIHDGATGPNLFAFVVNVTGRDHLIRYNTIFNASGPLLGGSFYSTEISHNHVFDGAWLHTDTGLIYLAYADYGDTQIRNNVFNDVHQAFANGVYFDLNVKNVLLFNNIMWDLHWAASVINSGAEFVSMVNNTVYRSGTGPWASREEFYTNAPNDMFMGVFANNVVDNRGIPMGHVDQGAIIRDSNYSRPGGVYPRGGGNWGMSPDTTTFVTPSPMGAVTANDLRLGANSGARGHGEGIYGLHATEVVDAGAVPFGHDIFRHGQQEPMLLAQIPSGPDIIDHGLRNLLYNSGFEWARLGLGTPGIPYWTLTGDHTAVTRQASAAADFARAREQFSVQLSGGPGDGVEQTITGLVPGNYYVMRGFARVIMPGAGGDTGQAVDIGIRLGNGETIYKNVYNVSHWNEVRIGFYADSGGTVTVFARKTTSGGSVLVDDFSIVRGGFVTAEIPPPPEHPFFQSPIALLDDKLFEGAKWTVVNAANFETDEPTGLIIEADTEQRAAVLYSRRNYLDKEFYIMVCETEDLSNLDMSIIMRNISPNILSNRYEIVIDGNRVRLYRFSDALVGGVMALHAREGYPNGWEFNISDPLLRAYIYTDHNPDFGTALGVAVYIELWSGDDRLFRVAEYQDPQILIRPGYFGLGTGSSVRMGRLTEFICVGTIIADVENWHGFLDGSGNRILHWSNDYQRLSHFHGANAVYRGRTFKNAEIVMSFESEMSDGAFPAIQMRFPVDLEGIEGPMIGAAPWAAPSYGFYIKSYQFEMQRNFAGGVMWVDSNRGFVPRNTPTLIKVSTVNTRHGVWMRLKAGHTIVSNWIDTDNTWPDAGFFGICGFTEFMHIGVVDEYTYIPEIDFDTDPAEVDRTALQELVNESVGLVEADYTAESWAPFALALANAQAVLANENATQAEVDAAYDALYAAILALVLYALPPDCDYCTDCGECQECSQCLPFDFNAWNNGTLTHQHWYDLGLVVLWFRFTPGGNVFISRDTLNVSAALNAPDGPCAMEFITIDTTAGSPLYANRILANFNAAWERIYLSYTVCEVERVFVIINPRPKQPIEPTLHRITFMRNGGTLNGVARDIAIPNVPSDAAFYSVPVEIPVAAREGFKLVHWRVDFAGENRTHLFLTSAELANFAIPYGHLHALPANSNLIIRAIWELAPVEPPECEDCNSYPCECLELCEYCNAYTCAPFSIRLYQRPNGAEMHRLRFNNPNPAHNNLIPAAQFSVTATLPDYTCAINLLTIVGGANNTIQRIDIPFGNWQTITVTVSRGCASDTVVLVNPLYTSN